MATRFTGVEPDPEMQGGYLFHREGAEPLYGWGPEADQLAQELQQTAPPDLRTAQAHNPSQPGELERYLAQTPPLERPVNTGPVEPWLQATQGQGRGLTVPPKFQSQPEPPPAPAGGPQPVRPLPGPPAPPAAPPQADIFPPERVAVPFSPAVSREQIQERAASAVGVPQSISREVQGAVPYDQQGLGIRTELEAERRGLASDVATRQSQEARAQELQFAATLPRLEMQAAEAEHQYQAVRNAYEMDRADLDGLISEHRERRVNPNRWFQNQTTFGQITTVLAQALGAFASTLAGGENWAQKAVDGAIEADIRSQELAIQQGGQNIESALAMLHRRYGDMEQAKASLRLAMHDVAAMEREELAAEARSQDVLDANAAWDLEYQEQREALERQIRDASIGKHTTKIAERAEFPRRASGGGSRPMTDEEETKYYERQARKAVARAKVQGGGVDPDVAAQAGGVRATAARKDVQDFGASLAASEETVANYDRVLQEAGLRYNPDTKKVDGYSGADIPGVGLVDSKVPTLLVGERGKRLRQALTNTLDAFGRARTGAAMPATEIEAFKKIILGSGTEREFVSGMEMLRSQIDAVRATHETRFGRDTVRQFQRNRQDIEVDRVQREQAAEVEPF